VQWPRRAKQWMYLAQCGYLSGWVVAGLGRKGVGSTGLPVLHELRIIGGLNAREKG
jgi:hypothetical protein